MRFWKLFKSEENDQKNNSDQGKSQYNNGSESEEKTDESMSGNQQGSGQSKDNQDSNSNQGEGQYNNGSESEEKTDESMSNNQQGSGQKGNNQESTSNQGEGQNNANNLNNQSQRSNNLNQNSQQNFQQPQNKSAFQDGKNQMNENDGQLGEKPDKEKQDISGEANSSKDTQTGESSEKSTNPEDATSKKEKLQELKNQLKDLLSQVNKGKENQTQTVKDAKKELEKSHLTGEKEQLTESVEENYDGYNANQELMDKLKELAPFQDRDRGPGYAIDTNGNTDVPDSVIRTLITKFLNQRFIKKETDLNVRSNSLERSAGFHRWDVKAVVTHLQTRQITKVLSDKYGYKYDNGKNEHVPLSFYFDLSGSMSRYTNLLATIAIELLKKDVKVLVGYNQRVNYQIDSIDKLITVQELAEALTLAGATQGSIVRDSNVKMKRINKVIDNYLISSKAEKCVVFSDFDPMKEIINLSQSCNVYWFCFETRYGMMDIEKYKGFIYPVQNIVDIAQGLLKVSNYRFETLCYLEKTSDKERERTL